MTLVEIEEIRRLTNIVNNAEIENDHANESLLVAKRV